MFSSRPLNKRSNRMPGCAFCAVFHMENHLKMATFSGRYWWNLATWDVKCTNIWVKMTGWLYFCETYLQMDALYIIFMQEYGYHNSGLSLRRDAVNPSGIPMPKLARWPRRKQCLTTSMKDLFSTARLVTWVLSHISDHLWINLYNLGSVVGLYIILLHPYHLGV